MLRAALKLAVLGYALLVLGNGLDRASAGSPALARYVPGLFAAEAFRVQAAAGLQAGDKPGAIAAATSAVLADPIDPRSAAVLGAAQLAAGKAVRADSTFRVAARFGWRDPLTQLYFMNTALAAGQPRLAAMRLDAILRQAPDFMVRDMLLARFEGTPKGRAALAERLALQPPWIAAYVGHIGDLALPALRSRGETLAGLGGPKWGCDVVAPLTAGLVQRGAVDSAKRLWLAHCPGAADGVADPHFTALPQNRPAVAFEWNLVPSGDISAAAAPGGKGLLVRVDGPSAQPVAWQLLSLAPGRYRLTWSALNAAGEPATGAEVSLSCSPSDRRPIPAVAAAGARGRFEALVTLDAACPGHFLTLWQVPGSEDVRFDDLAVTRP